MNNTNSIKHFCDINELLDIFLKESHLLEEGNRFACFNQLEAIISEKKGGYTWNERRMWLSTLYTCLAGPNCYFLNDENQVSEKEKKILSKYCIKLEKFQQAVEQERKQYSFIYTYLICIRDLLNKNATHSRKKSASNPLANKLRENLLQALDKRILQDAKYEHIKNEYQKVLKDTFQDKQERLNHPVFFLLLPYYLFFKLGQCEGLILENSTGPFSIPQISKTTMDWSIRNSFINADEENVYERLDELYDLIQSSLCKTLHDCGYHSIGRALLWTSYCCAEEYKRPEVFSYQKEDIEDLSLEYAVDFSAPILEYGVWIKLFCEQFSVEKDTMLNDVIQIFNLSFRPLSRPAERTIDTILQKYDQHYDTLSLDPFCLQKLLKALCNLYRFQYFDTVDPFVNESLRDSINLLLNFLIAFDIYPSEIMELSFEEKWLYLLRYGCSARNTVTDHWYGSVPNYLINPSYILYKAVLMRSFAQEKEAPSRYGLSSFFPYSNSLKMFSDSLYHALCSEKAVLQDVSYWGGIKVEMDKEYIHTLREAFHVWSVWHMDAAAPFEEFQKYVRNEAKDLSAALSKLEPFRSELVSIDLSGFDFDSEKDYALDEQKERLFTAIPKLK